MNKKLIYLACPYNDKSLEVREERYHAVTRVASILMQQGHFIFSPITHCHPMAISGNLPTGWDFWQEYDMLMISRCDELWVLTIPGWRESKGVTSEIQIALVLNKPIKYTDGVAL